MFKIRLEQSTDGAGAWCEDPACAYPTTQMASTHRITERFSFAAIVVTFLFPFHTQHKSRVQSEREVERKWGSVQCCVVLCCVCEVLENVG